MASNAPTETWRNRIVGHGEEAPDQLCANPRNWRIHPSRQSLALSAAISDVGFIKSVTVNRRTGYVVDGHLRVLLAIRDGVPTIPVEYLDLSEEEEAEALATLDPLAAMAMTDADKLDELATELNGSMSDPLAEMLDELILAAPLPEDGATAGRHLDGRTRSVKVVVNCGDVATVEHALAAAGIMNRGEALAVICRTYLDGHAAR